MVRTQYNRLYPCSMCDIENFCAANDWSLVDSRNKKCPNWLDGVKQYHKFLRKLKRDAKML